MAYTRWWSKPSRIPRLAAAAAVLIACCGASDPARAFYAPEHQGLTEFAFEIFREMYPEAFDRFSRLRGVDPHIRGMEYENISYAPPKPPADAGLVERVAWEALAPDCYRDLELVDVDLGRDDPHDGRVLENDDEATYSTKDDPLVGTLFELFGYVHNNFTALNHFINIGSYGRSEFDDYDGYSYQFIEKYGNQYQSDVKLFGKTLDEGVMWYYNDEYVHASGQQWYDGCSPSVQRYSYPTKCPDPQEEPRARFPLAKCVGHEGCGIPYSVFLPQDNMARYWFGRFLKTRDPLDLGPVMHAVGDACIPHHAAGYLGNWHQQYEVEIAKNVSDVIGSASDRSEIESLVRIWDRVDDDPPESLAPWDYERTPAINWSIENLVTWVALHAYRQYTRDYEPHYRSNGEHVIFDDRARESIVLATAMKVLVLKKALTVH